MTWRFESSTPIYQQIVTRMKEGIASGDYGPGSRLPSVRDIALEAGVNPNTMQRALAQLEQEGLVRTERTSGRYVTEDAKVLQALREDLASGYASQLVAHLTQLGMNPEEIMGAVAACLADGRKARSGERKETS